MFTRVQTSQLRFPATNSSFALIALKTKKAEIVPIRNPNPIVIIDRRIRSLAIAGISLAIG